MIASEIHAAVAAVCPIHGIGFVRAGDKQTWRIDFRADASDAERSAARALLAACDPQAVSPDEVRAEAGRRILARYPDWRQANMTARCVELTFRVAQGGTLTGDEAGEVAALQMAWGWITAVRAASDAIEALSPIPADFADDSRWPA